MGYTTDFNGRFHFNKPLDKETHAILTGLATTRRMKRQGLPEEYGFQGEFYYNPNSKMMGQEEEASIVDYNTPPDTQPGLWLQWIPSKDGKYLEWDGGEKFYHYVEWLEYLIKKILAPNGYSLTGDVEWLGEDADDRGLISIKDNVITVKRGRIVYE